MRLLIALAIVFAVLAFLYAIDRIVFGRSPNYATPRVREWVLFAIPAEPLMFFVFILAAVTAILAIPVLAVTLVQRLVLGRERAADTRDGRMLRSHLAALSDARRRIATMREDRRNAKK